MDSSEVDRHIAAYSVQRPDYEEFSARVKSLLESLLQDGKVDFHAVDSRAKTVASFGEKIQREGKNYANPMLEITDLCGCRVILYYADDISKAAEILKREFDLIEEELSHMPESQDSDRFGYVSAHYILALPKKRKELVEWRKFAKFKFEIQLRTVIQHAWSAVSHAVQYKQESRTASNVRRKLHRIAGLFELADEQFIDIRDAKNLRDEISVKQVESGNTSVELNPGSLRQFLSNWAEKERISAALHSVDFVVADDEEMADDVPAQILTLADKIEIHTLSELINFVENADLSIFERIARKDKPWRVDVEFGIVLLMLGHLGERVTSELLGELGWDDYSTSIMVDVLSTS